MRLGAVCKEWLSQQEYKTATQAAEHPSLEEIHGVTITTRRERESMTTSAEENARETLKPVVDFTILRPCWVMSKSI
jgi:hypothetical protein